MAGLKKERKLADLPCHAMPCHARKISLVILFNKPRVTVICGHCHTTSLDYRRRFSPEIQDRLSCRYLTVTNLQCINARVLSTKKKKIQPYTPFIAV